MRESWDPHNLQTTLSNIRFGRNIAAGMHAHKEAELKAKELGLLYEGSATRSFLDGCGAIIKRGRFLLGMAASVQGLLGGAASRDDLGRTAAKIQSEGLSMPAVLAQRLHQALL